MNFINLRCEQLQKLLHDKEKEFQENQDKIIGLDDISQTHPLIIKDYSG